MVSDCISRDAALKILNSVVIRYDELKPKYELIIIKSAMEKMADEIVKDLEKLPSVEPEKCGDCISRIDMLKKLNNLCNNTCEYSKIQRKSMCDSCNLDLVFDMINNAKAVESERKTGKWEWNQRTGEYECSECGCNPIYERTTPDVSEIDKYRYCRWCGSEMGVKV